MNFNREVQPPYHHDLILGMKYDRISGQKYQAFLNARLEEAEIKAVFIKDPTEQLDHSKKVYTFHLKKSQQQNYEQLGMQRYLTGKSKDSSVLKHGGKI